MTKTIKAAVEMTMEVASPVVSAMAPAAETSDIGSKKE
jgi:hypothetical protein